MPNQTDAERVAIIQELKADLDDKKLRWHTLAVVRKSTLRKIIRILGRERAKR